MTDYTYNSSRYWLDTHPLKVSRYLRNFFHLKDQAYVYNLLYNDFPSEGSKLVDCFSLSNEEKKLLLTKFLVNEPQITCGIFADQRRGKDATLSSIFEDCSEYCKSLGRLAPRIVTLGNIKCPPFVLPEDMYFSFKSIPRGSFDQEVWIYCSEIEVVLPAREGMSPENKLFSQLEGTMAQNHQKLFGCSKLASKVDINFLRGMNAKIFKFINPDKLKIEGVERTNIISPLSAFHLPHNPLNKSETLCCFNDYSLLINYELPSWWSSSYSEQFANIPDDKIYDFIEAQLDNGLTPSQLSQIIPAKFRVTHFTTQKIKAFADSLLNLNT
ncbi:MAG: hypothetical protein H7836_12915 [Magnetococcus sp. YQC-3]